LAVVQKIVQDHGGEIHVERTAQGMTVFRIVLPGRVPQPSGESEAQMVDLVPARPNNATQSSISHPSP